MATRREQIEDVASALFSDRGYKATSMRDIAAALDIQGGSLYAHIPSKEAVLAWVGDRPYRLVEALGRLLGDRGEQAAERFHQAVRPVAEGPGTAGERLRRMVDAHVRVVTEGRARAHVFLFE